MNLITSSDVAILLEALRSTNDETVLATIYHQADIATRQSALRGNPFYAPFCGDRVQS